MYVVPSISSNTQPKLKSVESRCVWLTITWPPHTHILIIAIVPCNLTCAKSEFNGYGCSISFHEENFFNHSSTISLRFIQFWKMEHRIRQKQHSRTILIHSENTCNDHDIIPTHIPWLWTRLQLLKIDLLMCQQDVTCHATSTCWKCELHDFRLFHERVYMFAYVKYSEKMSCTSDHQLNKFRNKQQTHTIEF